MNYLIVYWTTTWNNKAIAEEIGYILKKISTENSITIWSWEEYNASDLKKFDMVFIWASTWWDWDIQENMIDLVKDIEKTDLSGIKFSIFANWMIEFPLFCEAWKKIRKALEISWANIIWENFEINWDVEAKFDDLKEWVLKVI